MFWTWCHGSKRCIWNNIKFRKKFGSKRVFDIPCSENAITGVSIGASLNNTRSVVTHQRLDFFILAMDQLVNSAAKWYYMFNSKKSVPITIRLIIGRMGPGTYTFPKSPVMV